MKWLMPVLWLISFAGHLWFWIDRGGQRPAAAPLVAISAITAALYAGAIARLLLPAFGVLLFAGLALFGWMLCRRSKALLHMDLLLFAVGCVALALRYHDALLVQYDDYSHWGMIVRHLLGTNRLPQNGDALIAFQSYPPGAAMWIYFACRLLGGSEGVMLAAQACMTLAGWLPLFALVGGKWRISKRIVCAAMMIVGLSLFQGTASLMVDNLLAALAVGALCVCVLECHSGARHPWLTGVLLAVLSLVKDGGLFFVAVLALAYAGLTFQKKAVRPWIGRMAALLTPVAVSRVAWSVNIRLAFPAAGVSRHAFTLENMRVMGSDKSYGNIFQIGLNVLREAASLRNLAVQALCGMLVLAIVLWVLRRMKNGSSALGSEAIIVTAGAAVYAAWLISLWLMYTFSMTLESANSLVAFERYNSTCALFLLGMFAVWALSHETASNRDAALVVLCLCLPLLSGGWHNGVERLVHETYHVPLRMNMEQLAQQRPLKPEESAAVVIGPEENGMFAGYMARYTFQSADIQVVYPDRIDQNGDADVYYWACDEQPGLPAQAEIVQIITE